jgi:hypothetical protein
MVGAARAGAKATQASWCFSNTVVSIGFPADFVELRAKSETALIIVEAPVFDRRSLSGRRRRGRNKKYFGRWLMVDDARGPGALAREKRIAEQRGRFKKFDILVGALSEEYA